MQIVNILPNTDEWLEWREGPEVSASEAAIVMNVSDYMTPLQLYRQKMKLVAPEDLSKNPYVKYGVKNEKNARRAAEIALGGDPLIPLCGVSDEYPFMRASFDGVDSAGIPTELKCPSPGNFSEVCDRGVNSEPYQRYWPQVQHQILVANATHGWLVFWQVNSPPQVFRIERDDEYLVKLVETCRRFHEGLLNQVPPAPDLKRDFFMPESDLDKRLWMDVADQYVINQTYLNDLREQVKRLESTQKGLQEQLISQMGDYKHAEFAQVRVVVSERVGLINYSQAVTSLLPDLTEGDLESYRGSPSRAVRITLTNQELPKRSLDVSLHEKVQELRDDLPSLGF